MDSSDNSSVSSNLSDYNYDDSNSESDISIVSNESFSCGYVGEPEYNEEELKSKTFSSESENESNESDEDDDLNSSRQENLYWCKCTHCTVMPTLIECKCCREFQGLLDDKLENGCITSHKNFDTLCLCNIVLETAFIRYRRYKNIFTDVKDMTAK